MIINQTWEITKDPCNFIVIKSIPHDGGIAGGKEYKAGINKTHAYFTTLQQACKFLVRQSVDIESMKTIIATIEQSTADIETAIMKATAK